MDEEGKLANSYGVENIPSTAILDNNGRVVATPSPEKEYSMTINTSTFFYLFEFLHRVKEKHNVESDRPTDKQIQE